jgi:hypothetical protein
MRGCGGPSDQPIHNFPKSLHGIRARGSDGVCYGLPVVIRWSEVEFRKIQGKYNRRAEEWSAAQVEVLM